MNSKAKTTLCIIAGATVGPTLLLNVTFANPISARDTLRHQPTRLHDVAATNIISPKYGWSYVDLNRTFGPGTLISGLSSHENGPAQGQGQNQGQNQGQGQGALVDVTVTVPAFYSSNDSYQTAAYNSSTYKLGQATTGRAPKGYHGHFSLQWTNPYNANVLQHATIVSGKKTIASWPKSVPAYGDESQVAASGAVDNQIIGQSGDWVWIALKGPEKPPVTLPVYYLFRNWDRLMAVNVKTDAYRLFSIPALTAPNSESYVSSTPPAFATTGKTVFVGLSDWIGQFPADPSSIAPPRLGLGATTASGSQPTAGQNSSQQATTHQNTSPRTTSGQTTPSPSVKSITLPTPILHPVPKATQGARFTLAKTELAAAVRQEAGSIAYLWDHYVMKKNVPGVSGNTTSWMSDGAYINHGYVPSGMLYGAEFPTQKGSAQSKIQSQLITQLETIGKNPLPTSIYALDTPAKERKAFHGHPPASLPGYKIRGDVYVPDESTWPLPVAYRTYANVFTSIGPLLAQKSPYPVFLPTPSAEVGLSHYYANVKYSVSDSGYSLQVYAGNKLPANSKSILEGEANTDFTLEAQAANRPLSLDYRWNTNVAIKGAKVTTVNLGHGIVGKLYTKSKTSNQPQEQSIAWKEDGWTWGIESTYVSGGIVHQAKQEAGSLVGLRMPIPSGSGVFSNGSDAPSQVDFTWQNARYALYSTGWRAPQIAASMVNLSNY